jgi:hypothetical protein
MDRLGEGERQVRLGQDRLAIKKPAEKNTETSGNYVRCFTHTCFLSLCVNYYPPVQAHPISMHDFRLG